MAGYAHLGGQLQRTALGGVAVGYGSGMKLN